MKMLRVPWVGRHGGAGGGPVAASALRRRSRRGAGRGDLRRLVRRRHQDLRRRALRGEDRREVILTLGSSVDIAAKIRATAGDPGDRRRLYGPLDRRAAAQRGPARGARFLAAGEPSRRRRGRPSTRRSTFVNFMTAATVIAYNPEKVSPPPTFLGGPVRPEIRRQARDRRHNRHLGPALPDGR